MVGGFALSSVDEGLAGDVGEWTSGGGELGLGCNWSSWTSAFALGGPLDVLAAARVAAAAVCCALGP